MRLPRWGTVWPVACGVLGTLVFLALVSGRIVYRPFNAPSSSMSPSLEQGDYFLVASFAYRNTPPARGDVIVFWSPKDGSQYVKRVIGLPGERIQMVHGVVRINERAVGLRQVEGYRDKSCDIGDCTDVRQYEETLPGGRAEFVLDRGESPLDDTGVYRVPAHAYFVLGDNRDNSDDSRGSLGFIRQDDVVGRAAYVFLAGGRPVWRDVR